jgi:4'-phosphopantetheinyl transferase
MNFAGPGIASAHLPAGVIELWRLDVGATGGNSRETAAKLLSARFGGPPAAWLPEYDAHGRPQLPQHPSLDISIAHSGALWMLALAGSPRRIGLDIEALRARPNALEVARAQFPASEADWLQTFAADNRSAAFLRLWCAREAVLKAHGAGMSGGFRSVEFGFDGRRIRLVRCDAALGTPGDWQLREFVPARGHVGALAWRGAAAVRRGRSAARAFA